MGRLTKVDGNGNWHIEGVKWEECKGNLYGALCKLKDYEDTGLSPKEINYLNTFSENQAMIATAELQEEQRKHRWIPVTERLPDRYKVVIVTAKMKTDTEQLVYIGARGTGWDIWGVENSRDYEVIAWMRLPEPYEPESVEKRRK